jgi:hypothetical protein
MDNFVRSSSPGELSLGQHKSAGLSREQPPVPGDANSSPAVIDDPCLVLGDRWTILLDPAVQLSFPSVNTTPFTVLRRRILMTIMHMRR